LASDEVKALNRGISCSGLSNTETSQMSFTPEKQSCRRVATSQSHHDLLPITLLPIT